MPRGQFRALTAQELAQLRRFKREAATHWKAKLRLAWKGKAPAGSPKLHALVMALRDSHGLTWLSYFNLADETTRIERLAS